MKVTFEYEKQIQEITDSINRMPNLVQKEETSMLRKIGKAVQKYVVLNLRLYRMPEAKTRKRKNYDKSMPYIQMDEDVEVKADKTKEGDLYVSIKGGKYTGYKWHFLNDGTRNEDGSIHTAATHFMDRALKQAANEIEKIIDSTMRKVAEDDGG